MLSMKSEFLLPWSKWLNLRSPYIIKYREAFIEENPTTLCIIMEYANGGDLYQRIKKKQKEGKLFDEHEIWNVLTQVVMGLNALHKK